MEANFRRFSRAFRKKRQNRVSSLDNMLDERNPSTEGIKSSLSTDHFNFTGENDSDAVYVTRKRAWAESIDNKCDEDNKLTEDWMKDWQVRLKRSFRSTNQVSFYKQVLTFGSRLPNARTHPRVQARRTRRERGERPLYIRPKRRFISVNFQWRM